MSQEFYRFRSINKLISEFNELEDQSIFFAHPSQLNDPMEGYRDIFWTGDHIVWKNLFKHYLFCLERACSFLLLVGETQDLTQYDMPVFSSERDLPTTQYKELFKNIANRFFDNENLQTLIKKISLRSTPIKRQELLFYLSVIHPHATDAIFTEFENAKLLPINTQRKTNNNKDILDNIFIDSLEESLSKDEQGEKTLDALFFAFQHSNHQFEIIQRQNKIIDSSASNKNFVLIEFPEKYISQIEKIIYPDWYTACFMSECKNSSTWGHYGDNHSGACLIFSAQKKEDSYYIMLTKEKKPNPSTAEFQYQALKLHPINYTKGFGTIDFFRSLGRLTTSTLKSMWYTSENSTSICADDIFKSEGLWREKYWENFYRDITVKSDDWKYENEHRLILSNTFDDYSSAEERTLHYDFNTLKGIIFGIKTSKNDKLRIIKIIKDKCEAAQRTDFRFYQAYYSSESKRIEHTEMTLINTHTPTTPI